jgi:hypothetical protein
MTAGMALLATLKQYRVTKYFNPLIFVVFVALCCVACTGNT